MELWVNLDKFGIELKLVQIPNGNTFPVMIVNDIEKYNNSGAAPLDSLNNIDNPTKFIKLPGDRKGRNPNTPTYFLSKSVKNGVDKYDIKGSLSALLNISEAEVKKSYESREESSFYIKGGYADFDKFNQITDQGMQRFYGSTLYVVKEKKQPENLIDFSQKLIDQQHSLFPKTTVANIPFQSMDAFGLNSSIVDKAFLNPDDALKQGYTLNQLNAVRLQGDRAVLPISINKDNSVNIILDPNNIGVLAYTGYNWQKNFPLIEDYNALVSVREASRNLLNARTTDIKSAPDMERHIENMSMVLQNFNAAQTAIKLHKPLKFNANGVYTFLSKNKDNEWRLIEKEGFNKKDEPLNWNNYKKAIEKIASHNNIVSTALELRTFDAQQLDAALNKVFQHQEKLFKKYVKVVDDHTKKSGLDAVVINEMGSKINAAQFDASRRKFDRDVGESLQTEQITSTINALAAVPDAGNIRNTMGQHIDAFSLQNTVTINPGQEPATDILDIYEKGLSGGSAPQNTEDALRSSNTTLDADRKVTDVAPLISDNNNAYDYGNLPKNMSPKIDDNYSEVNAIFQAMQRLNLSDIPYWKKSLLDAKEVKSQISETISRDIEQLILSQAKSGAAPVEIKLSDDQKSSLKSADKTIQDISIHLGKEQLKANILQYQFAKFTQGLDHPTYGGWVFGRDEAGNLKPFESKSEYEYATKLVENGFLKSNAENGSLLSDKGPVRQKIENAYQISSTDVNNIFENIDLLNNAVRSKLQFVDLDVDSIAVSHLSDDLRTSLFNNIVSSLNDGLSEFNQTQNDAHLDKTLSNVSKILTNIEKQSGLPVGLNNPNLNSLIKNYAVWDKENPTKIYDSSAGIPLSSRAKIDALKGLAGISFAHIKGVDGLTVELKERQIETGEILAKSYTKNELKISNIDVDKYQYALSGAFSVINQSHPAQLIGVPSSDERFGLSISDSENSYKIIKFDVKNAPSSDSVNKTLEASSLEDAKKEAFMLYQTHAIAGLLGIGNNELNQIGEIAKAIREGNEQKVREYSGKLLGIEFSTDDLLDMKYSLSEDSNRVNNKDYLIETPDTGLLKFDPLQGADVVNQISLIHKLTGTDSNFDMNPLIKKIDNLDKYNNVQQYLNISNNEQHELNSISLSYPINDKEISTISGTLANQVLTGFNALNKNNPDMRLTEGPLSIITSVPRDNSDLVTARIIPNEWLNELNLHNRNQLNLNISNIKATNISQGKVSPAAIKEIITQHVTGGDGVRNVSSKPILLDAVLNNPSQKANLTHNQHQILKEGSLHFVRELFFSNKPTVDVQIATTNLEVALTNLPKDLRSELIHQMQSPNPSEHNQSLRLSMGPQVDVQIPELRLGSVHDCIPHNHTIIKDITANQMAQMLNAADATYDKDLKKFDIPKFDAVKLNGILALHKNALDIVSFDFKKYQDNVVAKYNAIQPEPHSEFLKNFPMENLTINDVESVYANILVNNLNQIRKETPSQDRVYLSFGKEELLPQMYLSTQQTVDSFEVDSSINNIDVAKSIISSTSLFAVQVPKDAIIDHMQPVALPNAEVNEKSLLIVRQNFIEQFKKLADMSATVNKISETVDHAHLYALNDGQNTTFALAASKARVIDLAQKGCSAVISQINHNGTATPKNLLGQMTAPDEQLKQGLVSFVNNLPVIENKGLTSEDAALKTINTPRSKITAIAPLAVFKDELETKHKVVSQQDIDASQELVEVIKTEYAEPMIKQYSPDQVALMSGADIQDKIQLDKIWPKQNLEKHIASQHQNIDALILDRTIRHILPDAPNMRDGLSLNVQASSYVYFINEVHKGLSASNTINDVLDGFQKAVVKTNIFNPEFLASQDDFATKRMDALLKAAYQKNTQGVDLSQALTENIKTTNVLRIYEGVVNDLSKIEKLYSNEKSFINYLNGPVLNAPTDQVQLLNNALTQRMIDNRNPPTATLNSFEINLTNALIRADLSAKINGKSPVDYNSEDTLKNLNEIWGVQTSIEPHNKIFEKGYVDAANKGLQELHSSLGGANSIHPKDLSLGDMTLELGSINQYRDANYVCIPTMQAEIASKLIKNHWVANLTAKIESEELKVMPSDHLAKYAEFINEGKTNNQNLGLVSYVENFGYKPQTEALKSLVQTFQNLKNNPGIQENANPSSQLVDHAALVQTQKEVAFARKTMSYDSYDDDMRNRTFFVESYANQFVKDMSLRQDDMFRKIEAKVAEISKQANGATDLYDFNQISGLVDKVVSIPLPSSKTTIEKFADSVKNSNIAKEHGYDKESIVLEITSSVESKSTTLMSAQDVLASRAATKFISLMDKYAPESIKDSPEYVREINKYFNLGESSEFVAPNFKSQFGQAFEREFEKNAIYSEDEVKFTPEDITMRFLNVSISNESDQYKIAENEKSMGINQLVEMVKSLPVQSKENINYSPTLEKDHTNKFEIN